MVDLHYWPDRWAWFAQRGVAVHVRLDRRGPLGDPAGEAAAVASLAGTHPEVTSWIPRNEPQLESPGATPTAWRDYLRAFVTALPAELHGRVAIPPLCPEIALDEWLRASVEGGAGLGLMHAHAYGDSVTVTARLAAIRRHWRGRLLVTEWNYGAGRAVGDADWATMVPGVVAAANKAGVEALCVFIWAWQTPDTPLPTTVDVAESPAVQQALRVAAAAPEPPDPAPVARLWLAVIPSNQDHNRWIEQGKPTNECAQMALFSARMLGVSRDYPAVKARVFTPCPESADTYHLQGLYEVQARARAWLDTAPKGTYTVALNLHSDSGRYSHVGYYWRSDTDGADVSHRLARALCGRLKTFWPAGARIVGGAYDDYVFAQAIGEHCPVLLELGSHQVPLDLAIIREKGYLVARALVRDALAFFGLPN